MDYGDIDHTQNNRDINLNTSENAYEPVFETGNRFRTNRKQRLKGIENDNVSKPTIPKQSRNGAKIYFPGEMRIREEIREKPSRYAMPNKMNLNRSQNIHLSNKSYLEESPKEREMRIKEAVDDHSRETAEQSRYFNRLDRSVHKQKAIFNKHYDKYIIPNVMRVNAKKEQGLQRMREAKRRMDQLEIEQDNNLYTLKKEYNDYLRNQMAEKQRQKEQSKEEKQRLHDHMEYKIKMLKDEQMQK